MHPTRRSSSLGRAALATTGALALVLLLAAGRSSVAGTMVPMKSGSETIQAYLAAPAPPRAGTTSPALVIVHEWYGLSDWVKGVADRFAAQGYVVIAPDLYRGKLATADQPELAHELMRGLPDARAIRDLRAGAAYLRTRHDLKPGRTAIIGFCMGGRLALLASLDRGPFDATAVCYGSPETDPAHLRTLHGPVLGIYGADDRGIGADQTGPFETSLRKVGHLYAVKTYPGVGHGFLRDAGSPAGEAQQKLAWTEIDGFLGTAIGGKRK